MVHFNRQMTCSLVIENRSVEELIFLIKAVVHTFTKFFQKWSITGLQRVFHC
jgi:hypothetical protein